MDTHNPLWLVTEHLFTPGKLILTYNLINIPKPTKELTNEKNKLLNLIWIK